MFPSKMKRRRLMKNFYAGILLAGLLVMGIAGFSTAEVEKKMDAAANPGMIAEPGDLNWAPGPSSLPAGVMMAVLEGDPMGKGPFTMRLKLPAGAKVPPHWHPGIEHVTVISGTFNLGKGEKEERTKGKALPAGSFFVMEPKTPHFAWVDEEVVVQLHGMGPWGINYVNPADDPRGRK